MFQIFFNNGIGNVQQMLNLWEVALYEIIFFYLLNNRETFYTVEIRSRIQHFILLKLGIRIPQTQCLLIKMFENVIKLRNRIF